MTISTRARGLGLTTLLCVASSLACGNWKLQTNEQPSETRAGHELAPAFSLANDDGTFVTLDELLADGRPAVLVFYRGHW